MDVISISDITNELGKRIDPEFMTFKKLPERHLDSQVNQSKPDHTKWLIWFKFIANITRKRQKYLILHLSAWIVEYGQIRRKYLSYRTKDKLCKMRQGKVYAQNITTIGGTEWSGLSQEAVQEIPAEAVPCLQSYTGWLYTSYKVDGNGDINPNIQEKQQQMPHTIRGKRITGDYVKFMRQEIQMEIMEKYYRGKLGPKYEQIE